jgi:hypothetical protein
MISSRNNNLTSYFWHYFGSIPVGIEETRIQYYNYTIYILYTSLLYANWYTAKIMPNSGKFQYTSLFTVYEPPLIRISDYKIDRFIAKEKMLSVIKWSNFHKI